MENIKIHESVLIKIVPKHHNKEVAKN